MKRPARSRFMGHSYKINYPKEVKVDEQPANGSCDNNNNIIEVEAGLTPSMERETLVHEVLHQLLEHFPTGFPEQLEEPTVKFLGAALCSHIEQNKGFWLYVTRDLKNGVS